MSFGFFELYKKISFFIIFFLIFKSEVCGG